MALINGAFAGGDHFDGVIRGILLVFDFAIPGVVYKPRGRFRR